MRYPVMEVVVAMAEAEPRVVDEMLRRNGLKQWVYVDLQDRDEKETAALALQVLVLVTNRIDLPSDVRAQFGFNLVDVLIEEVLQFDDAEEKNDRWGARIHAGALRALLCVNLHSESSDAESNRVLNKLLYSDHDVQRLGQIFIRLLIRGQDEVAVPALAKLMHDIFMNELAAKSFFFTNDLNSLVEVLLQSLRNLANETFRSLYLEILADVVERSEYRDLLHRQDELVALLSEIAESETDSLSPKAQALLNSNEWLR